MALISFAQAAAAMFKSFRSVITLRLILLMALMLLVLFTVNTVRVVKDHLILTFLGAEIISFIKLWIEIPVAVNDRLKCPENDRLICPIYPT